jgi:chromosome segregation ATPase
MRAVWLRDVQAILARSEVVQWWEAMGKGLSRLEAMKARCEELEQQVRLTEFRAEQTQKNAADALYQAGEYEDTAARIEREAAEIENRSYEAVAQFEAQRLLASDLFSRMGACEHALLTLQTEAKTLSASVAGAADAVRREELTRALRRKEGEVQRAERDLRDAAASYERENTRKLRLWEEVEQMWSRSLDLSLAVAEKRLRSRRTRQRAEQLFREAEEHKARVESLRHELEENARRREEIGRALEELRRQARQLMGCLVGEEFLYWPRRDDNQRAFCVPISDHATGFNIELRARTVYQVGRQRGVQFIEPLVQGRGIAEDADRRLDDFFTAGRKR